MIVNNTYVDDILYSIDSVENAFNLIQRTENVIALGNFHIKYWIVSGQHTNHKINILKSDNEKILELKWNPKEDEFLFKVKVKFSPKVRGVRSGPNCSSGDICLNFPVIVTRRMILSQVASFYDPLGLIAPVVLRAKVLMRFMISKCDEPLNADIVNEWKDFFTELYEVEN